jgi:branched-chain amino acid transport system ATP-binding protein
MVLLDEPMARIAPTLALQLLEHILDLRASRGTTFLVIEHDMEAIMAISDHVVVMDDGRVIARGLPDEIQNDERVIDAYLGHRADVGAALVETPT